MQTARTFFSADLRTIDTEVAVLVVQGNVDLLSMTDFESALEDLIAARPRQAVVDVSHADFLSVQAYEQIGRCSRRLDRMLLDVSSDLAARVLRVLGYDGVACVLRTAADYGD